MDESKYIAKGKKKKARSKRSEKTCRGCGVFFLPKRREQLFCSRDCNFKSKSYGSEKIECSCCVCGTKVWKTRTNLKWHPNTACSTTCQKISAAIGTKAVREKEWQLLRSKKAKEKRKTSNRLQRSKVSEKAKWWRKCKSVTGEKSDVSKWDKRAVAAANSLRIRKEWDGVLCRQQKSLITGWHDRVQVERKKILQSKALNKVTGWKRKCLQISSSSAKRFRRLVLTKELRLKPTLKRARQLKLFES